MLRTRLFEIIDARGIRYRWLAEKMGYSPEYITRVKSGAKPITDEFRRRACALFPEIPESLLFFADSVDSSQHSLTNSGAPAEVAR